MPSTARHPSVAQGETGGMLPLLRVGVLGWQTTEKTNGDEKGAVVCQECEALVLLLTDVFCCGIATGGWRVPQGARCPPTTLVGGLLDENYQRKNSRRFLFILRRDNRVRVLGYSDDNISAHTFGTTCTFFCRRQNFNEVKQINVRVVIGRLSLPNWWAKSTTSTKPSDYHARISARDIARVWLR